MRSSILIFEQALVMLENNTHHRTKNGRDNTGTLLVPKPNQLPRVARTQFHKQQGWTSPRDRHVHNTVEFVKKRQR